MLISSILLIITFILLIVLIAVNKIDKSVVALAAGTFSFIVLSFLEGATFNVVVDFLIGTPQDGYVNLHAIILIFGMMVIVQICIEGGVFQFLAFRLIQMTKGKPLYLLIVFCSVSFFMAAIINDILTVIVLIPLTISVCKILDINPIPYIVIEGITVKLGGSVFLISSIPSVLIATYLRLSFVQFFLDIGILSIAIFVLTIMVFIGIYKNKLSPPRKGIDMLLEFNVWTFIVNRALMIKSILVLIGVIICFIIIPTTILSPDIIALIGAIILVIISGMDTEHIFEKIDFKLILYLMGIFLMVGGLEYMGIIKIIANSLGSLTTDDLLLTFIITLWLSAIISAFIDNITVAKILMPTVNLITLGYNSEDRIFIYSGMCYGLIWGDNLTPFGDTIILMNIAEKNGSHIRPVDFFKVAFPVAIFQLCMVSIIYSLIIRLYIGLILLAITFGIIIFIFIVIRYKKEGSFPIKLKRLKV
jgi:Na+/H+ antiporter NhaD/arsenite permease-like protein